MRKIYKIALCVLCAHASSALGGNPSEEIVAEKTAQQEQEAEALKLAEEAAQKQKEAEALKLAEEAAQKQKEAEALNRVEQNQTNQNEKIRLHNIIYSKVKDKFVFEENNRKWQQAKEQGIKQPRKKQRELLPEVVRENAKKLSAQRKKDQEQQAREQAEAQAKEQQAREGAQQAEALALKQKQAEALALKQKQERETQAKLLQEQLELNQEYQQKQDAKLPQMHQRGSSWWTNVLAGIAGVTAAKVGFDYAAPSALPNFRTDFSNPSGNEPVNNFLNPYMSVVGPDLFNVNLDLAAEQPERGDEKPLLDQGGTSNPWENSFDPTAGTNYLPSIDEYLYSNYGVTFNPTYKAESKTSSDEALKQKEAEALKLAQEAELLEKQKQAIMYNALHSPLSYYDRQFLLGLADWAYPIKNSALY